MQYRDKSDEIISKISNIKVDLIKQIYETNGLDLGETNVLVEYKNYLVNTPMQFSADGNIISGNPGDNPNANYNIGSGSRAQVIKALGFSDNPTQSECDAMMTTVTLPGYNRKLQVHKNLAEEVKKIFQELYDLGMELNNYIGGYCFRTINNPKYPNAKTLSMHSFGCAIDINYNLNPFSKNPVVKNDDVSKGIVRTFNNPIVQTFAKYGWGWGGRYYDYMHFSKANGG